MNFVHAHEFVLLYFMYVLYVHVCLDVNTCVYKCIICTCTWKPEVHFKYFPLLFKDFLSFSLSYVCVPCTLLCSKRPEEGIDSPEIGVTSGCRLPCEC